MTTEFNIAIKVAVVFSRGQITPVWFSWDHRQIHVRETTFAWKTWEGKAAIYHFSVTDGQGLYELCYNATTLNWRLANTE